MITSALRRPAVWLLLLLTGCAGRPSPAGPAAARCEERLDQRSSDGRPVHRSTTGFDAHGRSVWQRGDDLTVPPSARAHGWEQEWTHDEHGREVRHWQGYRDSGEGVETRSAHDTRGHTTGIVLTVRGSQGEHRLELTATWDADRLREVTMRHDGQTVSRRTLTHRTTPFWHVEVRGEVTWPDDTYAYIASFDRDGRTRRYRESRGILKSADWTGLDPVTSLESTTGAVTLVPACQGVGQWPGEVERDGQGRVVRVVSSTPGTYHRLAWEGEHLRRIESRMVTDGQDTLVATSQLSGLCPSAVRKIHHAQAEFLAAEQACQPTVGFEEWQRDLIREGFRDQVQHLRLD
ncbi:MAG: hypothetical protein EOO75_11055 [Myxococcales bacterium]|nr:MAG: hypothetical protein EOO75_11055 [Myxococcales bacterium]